VSRAPSLAESFVDSFKTELISDGGFNHDRLHEALGDVPPAEMGTNRVCACCPAE